MYALAVAFASVTLTVVDAWVVASVVFCVVSDIVVVIDDSDAWVDSSMFQQLKEYHTKNCYDHKKY